MSGKDTAGVIAPPPLLALGAIVCAWGMEQAAPSGFMGAGASRWLIAGALIVGGVSLMAAAFTSFGRAGTAVRTHEPSTALVTTGIYGLVRNPIYVGFFLVLIGIAFAAGWAWLLFFAVVFLGVIHWGVVRREERYLTAKFGDAYAAYLGRVRRYGLC
jgi:protein-S-isoprenylcysteine O-methyltransferase Ste14